MPMGALLPMALATWLTASSSGNELDIDLVDVVGKGKGDLGRRLADAREDDALARHARRERAAEFAFRENIGAGTEAGQRRDNREVGIGLDRIAHQRLASGEGGDEASVLPFKPGGGIAIERRSHRLGDAGERQFLGMKGAAAIGEIGRPRKIVGHAGSHWLG